jgi:hypothetical protein
LIDEPWAVAASSQASVVRTGDKMDQQKVNNAVPKDPNRLEVILLNQSVRPVYPSRMKSLASTLNPKVEGSNPSRPTSSDARPS